MSISTNAAGIETWIEETFLVKTWMVDFWDRNVKDFRSKEVVAYSVETAIDVAVDDGICAPEEVTARNRVFEVTSISGGWSAPTTLTNNPVFFDELP